MSEVTANISGFTVRLELTVPKEDAGEYWSVSVKSDTERKIRISFKQTWSMARFGIHTAEEGIPYVSVPMDKLVKNRLDFIVKNHQYKREGSHLDGAFLVHDNAEEHPVFDDSITEHNTCRERIGMALLLIKYLQKHEKEEYKKALDRYIAFLYREFFDAEHVKELFTAHVNNMVSNGTACPKHELNYEQTIVSPAATFISEWEAVTGNEIYKAEVKKHIEILISYRTIFNSSYCIIKYIIKISYKFLLPELRDKINMIK